MLSPSSVRNRKGGFFNGSGAGDRGQTESPRQQSKKGFPSTRVIGAAVLGLTVLLLLIFVSFHGPGPDDGTIQALSSWELSRYCPNDFVLAKDNPLIAVPTRVNVARCFGRHQRGPEEPLSTGVDGWPQIFEDSTSRDNVLCFSHWFLGASSAFKSPSECLEGMRNVQREFRVQLNRLSKLPRPRGGGESVGLVYAALDFPSLHSAWAGIKLLSSEFVGYPQLPIEFFVPKSVMAKCVVLYADEKMNHPGGITCRELTILGDGPSRGKTGVGIRAQAILQSSFDRVIYTDPNTFLMQDPRLVLQSEAFQSTGAVFVSGAYGYACADTRDFQAGMTSWPQHVLWQLTRNEWQPDRVHAQDWDDGLIFIDKARHMGAIKLAAWLCSREFVRHTVEGGNEPHGFEQACWKMAMLSMKKEFTLLDGIPDMLGLEHRPRQDMEQAMDGDDDVTAGVGKDALPSKPKARTGKLRQFERRAYVHNFGGKPLALHTWSCNIFASAATLLQTSLLFSSEDGFQPLHPGIPPNIPPKWRYSVCPRFCHWGCDEDISRRIVNVNNKEDGRTLRWPTRDTSGPACIVRFWAWYSEMYVQHYDEGMQVWLEVDESST